MEQNRIRLMEKLDRSFTKHPRRASESDRSAYPAELIAVYEYLKGGRLRNYEVCTLRRRPPPFLFLAKMEGGVIHPLLIIGVRLHSFWQASSRKRREMLMGSQQVLYGD